MHIEKVCYLKRQAKQTTDYFIKHTLIDSCIDCSWAAKPRKESLIRFRTADKSEKTLKKISNYCTNIFIAITVQISLFQVYRDWLITKGIECKALVN